MSIKTGEEPLADDDERLAMVKLRLEQGFYHRPEVLAAVADRLMPQLMKDLPEGGPEGGQAEIEKKSPPLLTD